MKICLSLCEVSGKNAPCEIGLRKAAFFKQGAKINLG